MLEKPEFQALQSLLYEGEPEEIAQNFLNHGNESLKASNDLKGEPFKLKIADAMNCYSEGIAQNCKDSKINYELHLGMAKAEMSLKNYGKLKEQVELAIKFKETAEIFYLGAWSRFHVNKWQECIDFCKKALILDENHKEAKSFMAYALGEMMKEKKKMDEMALINKLEEAKKLELFSEIQKYGIKVGKQLHYLPQDIGASLYLDDYNVLHFPVIILYDEFMQCDFIQDFPMDSTFEEQLKIVLEHPAPWDPEHRYKLKSVDVFYETNITEPLSAADKVVE